MSMIQFQFNELSQQFFYEQIINDCKSLDYSHACIQGNRFFLFLSLFTILSQLQVSFFLQHQFLLCQTKILRKLLCLDTCQSEEECTIFLRSKRTDHKNRIWIEFPSKNLALYQIQDFSFSDKALKILSSLHLSFPLFLILLHYYQ